MSDFDDDARLTPDGQGAFAVGLSPRWTGHSSVNGGYMLAVCTRALGEIMPFPDPIVVSAFFLRPGSPGPARVTTELVRAGRTTAFGQASMVRDGKEVVRATAAFSRLSGSGHGGPQPARRGTPPRLPPPGDCIVLPGDDAVPITGRFEYGMPELPGWLAGRPSGDSAAEFWMRLRDGSDADLGTLPLIVDSAPPVVLELGALSTTVELTVHLRAHPAPGWLACRAETRHVSGGYHEEDFEIWDSAGVLVAQSRQLALLLD